MHRWQRLDVDLFPSKLGGKDAIAPSASGLVLTCSEDCFPPDFLASQLESERWRWHRTDGAIVPPRGAGHEVEEELIEEAIEAHGVRRIVVCGHWPCGIIARLLAADQSIDDFVLRHWLSHADVVRAMSAGAPDSDDRLRAAVAQTVLLQLTHLQTHPAVALACHRGRLTLSGWLHDDRAGELFYAAPGSNRFDRRVALSPAENDGLRPAVVTRKRARALPHGGDAGRPYLA